MKTETLKSCEVQLEVISDLNLFDFILNLE